MLFFDRYACGLLLLGLGPIIYNWVCTLPCLPKLVSTSVTKLQSEPRPWDGRKEVLRIEELGNFVELLDQTESMVSLLEAAA